MILEEKSLLIKKINEWKKDLTPDDLKSVINQIEDPVSKLIAEKMLLKGI